VSATSGPDGCGLCAGNDAVADGSAPPRERVHLTDRWRLTAHRSALAGWMLLIPRRHVESLHELTDAEAAELGPLIRAATAVMVDELGAAKSYVMQFAEGTRHAHFSLVPRMADLPVDRVGAKVSAYNSSDEPLPEARRDELAARLSAAWPAARSSL